MLETPWSEQSAHFQSPHNLGAQRGMQHRSYTYSNKDKTLTSLILVNIEWSTKSETASEENREMVGQNSSNMIISKKTGIISSRFEWQTITDDRKQSITSTTTDYEVVSKHQHLSPSLKAEYLVYTLSSDAKEFFLSLYRESMTYEEIKQVMLSEYNSAATRIPYSNWYKLS